LKFSHSLEQSKNPNVSSKDLPENIEFKNNKLSLHYICVFFPFSLSLSRRPSNIKRVPNFFGMNDFCEKKNCLSFSGKLGGVWKFCSGLEI
jgi:hypothetical protein